VYEYIQASDFRRSTRDRAGMLRCCCVCGGVVVPAWQRLGCLQVRLCCPSPISLMCTTVTCLLPAHFQNLYRGSSATANQFQNSCRSRRCRQSGWCVQQPNKPSVLHGSYWSVHCVLNGWSSSSPPDHELYTASRLLPQLPAQQLWSAPRTLLLFASSDVSAPPPKR
jgi:hypothetical protein